MMALLFKLDGETRAALVAEGILEQAQGISNLAIYGFWIFWGYFAYLLLFALLVNIWPNYVGLMVTDWVAATLPHNIFGIFTVSARDLMRVDAAFTRSVAMHIVVWQLLVTIWLWACTILRIRLIRRIFIVVFDTAPKQL